MGALAAETREFGARLFSFFLCNGTPPHQSPDAAPNRRKCEASRIPPTIVIGGRSVLLLHMRYLRENVQYVRFLALQGWVPYTRLSPD